ncbi:hypothetical protein ABPG75_009566 [Micractinium tetrahymenae]
MGASDGDSLGAAALFHAFLPLYFTHLNQGILTTLPFTLAVYMVRDFEAEGGRPPSEATVGRLTGLLAAVFCAAQLVTSYPWGIISDRVGRKPVMIIGNISCVLGVLGFGLAGSYAQAMAARAVGGALNAIILAEKAMLGEGVPRASQATAFGNLSLCWGLGTLAGPMIGGSLAAPCSSALRMEALCREGSLLVLRPYFLPCLVAGVLSAIATVMTLGWLDETLPSRRSSPGPASGASPGASSAARYLQVPAAEEREAAGGLAGRSGEVELGGLPPLSPASSSSELQGDEPISSSGGGSKGKRALSSKDGGGRLRAFRGDSARMSLGGSGEVPATSKGRLGLGGGGGGGSRGKLGGTRFGGGSSDTSPLSSLGSEESEGELELGLGGAAAKERATLLDSPASLAAVGGAELPAAAEAAAAAEADLPWHKQKVVRLSLCGYGLIAFLFSVLDEVTPIFASGAVAEGGLGFTPSQLALSLSFSGLVLVTWALLGYPRLSKRLGVVRVLRIGLWHTAPVAILTPASSLFAGAQLPSQALMFAALGFRAVTATNAFTSCLILVNAAAPEGSLGKVNGVGQSIASLVRAAGPALGGLTWAWSLQLSGLAPWPAWLPHQYLPFALVALLALSTDLVYRGFRLPGEGEEVGAGAGASGKGAGDGDSPA